MDHTHPPTHTFETPNIQAHSPVCWCTPCTHAASQRHEHLTQTNTYLRLWVSHCVAQQGLGSWGFPHGEKQVTSAQLPYKSMYSTAMWRHSCSVCSKTCKYRTGRKNLFMCVGVCVYVRQRLRERERERERKTQRTGGESSQRSLKESKGTCHKVNHLNSWDTPANMIRHTHTHVITHAVPKSPPRKIQSCAYPYTQLRWPCMACFHLK